MEAFAEVARESSLPFVLRGQGIKEVEDWAVRKYVDAIIANTSRREVIELYETRAAQPMELFKETDPFERLRNLHYWKEQMLSYVISPPRPYFGKMDEKQMCLSCRKWKVIDEGTVVCGQCDMEVEPSKMPSWL
ncbi:MAG: hypothetical protein GY821_07935 [Gammaproteobacteria bacterium]|nr:hypothetical protein [Gammaproteobacteria bacterium]